MSEGLLLACAAATLYMVGLTWFVQIVHYPLFAEVGRESFEGYHQGHSSRTTLVVAVPMLVELVTAVLLAIHPPAGQKTLALVGAGLAVSVWAVTVLRAAPIHSRIGKLGPQADLLSRLGRASLVRTWLWTFHGVIVLVMIGRLIVP
jgi:hypothetical protein